MAGCGSANSTPSLRQFFRNCAARRVAVVRRVVARLVAIEDQPNDVRRVPLVELILQLGADHVVRRSDRRRSASRLPQVVTQSAKGLNFRHGDVGGSSRVRELE